MSVSFQMGIVEPYVIVAQHLWQARRHEFEYQIETETVTEMIQQLYDLKHGNSLGAYFIALPKVRCHLDGDLVKHVHIRSYFYLFLWWGVITL